MSVKLHVAIMAHQDRAHLYEPLAEKLGAEPLVDDGSLGRWGNGRRCLQSYDSAASHVMVVQDDAVVPVDLVDGVTWALEHLPPSILCLYSGRLRAWRRIHGHHAKPPCWLQMRNIQWGVALVVPTADVTRIVTLGDRLVKMDNYDARLGEANMRTAKLPVLYPSPSWVDHAYTPSLVPGRLPNRHALQFLGQDRSIMKDWGPEQAPVIRVPDFVRTRVAAQAAIYGGR